MDRRRHTDDPIGIWVAIAAVLTGLAVLAYWVSGAFAAELPRKGKIAAPPAQQTYQPPAYTAPVVVEPEYRAHTFYLGGVAGYGWGIRERTGVDAEEKPFTFIAGDETWQGGIVAGYLYRSGMLGLGIEADYVIRDLGDFAIDDGTASVRGRAGLFLGAGTFLYGTAGVAQAYTDTLAGDFRKGLVVGGGVEKDLAANLALRVEALHYRHGDSHFEWGEEGSTAVRGGLIVKF